MGGLASILVRIICGSILSFIVDGDRRGSISSFLDITGDLRQACDEVEVNKYLPLPDQVIYL